MLPRNEVLVYFRLGLVTGLVDRPEVIAWADRALLQAAQPDEQLIELSLAGGLPYSQLIYLLTSFHGLPDYPVPVRLLAARAGEALAADHSQAARIIQGLRLLKAEDRYRGELRAELPGLERNLDLFKQGQLSAEELYQRLAQVLEPYKAERDLLHQITEVIE